jgi:hypothetical protein
VFNLDEVSFIQNLVFYIESAYCVPVSIANNDTCSHLFNYAWLTLCDTYYLI